LDLGGDVANLPPSETPQVLDGYYEGSTEEGDEVAFIVSRALPDLQVDRDRPWKIAVIRNFKAKLNIRIIDSEEGDYDSPVRSRPRTWPSKTMALSCIGPRTPLSCSSTGFCFPADRPEVHASGS
jgi:hypothetical protein